jgi:hypothetical protein
MYITKKRGLPASYLMYLQSRAFRCLVYIEEPSYRLLTGSIFFSLSLSITCFIVSFGLNPFALSLSRPAIVSLSISAPSVLSLSHSLIVALSLTQFSLSLSSISLSTLSHSLIVALSQTQFSLSLHSCTLALLLSLSRSRSRTLSFSLTQLLHRQSLGGRAT